MRRYGRFNTAVGAITARPPPVPWSFAGAESLAFDRRDIAKQAKARTWARQGLADAAGATRRGLLKSVEPASQRIFFLTVLTVFGYRNAILDICAQMT
jgi:hypothetical protein